MDTGPLLYTGTGLATLAAALLPRLLNKAPISMPMLFLGAGVLTFSVVPLPAPDPVQHSGVVVHLTELCVIVSLMGAGLALNRVVSRRGWSTTWRLLGITMPLSMLAVGLLGWGLLGFGIATSILLAGALAPTDPVLASEVQVAEPAENPEFMRELAEGWREFRSRHWLCVTIIQFALINAYAIGAFLVLGPFVAEKHLGGAAAWGFILAAEAAGMICAGLVALRYRPERPLLVATLAVLTMAPLLAFLGLAAPLTVILPAAFVAGVGLELYGVFWDTTLQQHIPDEKLSRVSSYDVLGSFALIPVGVAVMGPISNAIGVAETLLGAAVVVVVATIAVISVPDVRNLRRLDPAPTGGRAPLPPQARTRWLRPGTAPAPAATRR